MTVGFYARRNHLPLDNVTVSLWHSRIHARDCEDCETKEGMVDRIDVEVELTGSLTAEQHAKLMEIAAKMPCSSDAHVRDQHQVANAEKPAA